MTIEVKCKIAIEIIDKLYFTEMMDQGLFTLIKTEPTENPYVVLATIAGDFPKEFENEEVTFYVKTITSHAEKTTSSYVIEGMRKI